MIKLTDVAHVLLKLLGLYFIIEGVVGAAFAIVYSSMVFADEVSYTGESVLAYPAGGAVSSGIALLIGLGLFVGAEKVVGTIVSDSAQPGM